jgi:hypothetical protein
VGGHTACQRGIGKAIRLLVVDGHYREVRRNFGREYRPEGIDLLPHPYDGKARCQEHENCLGALSVRSEREPDQLGVDVADTEGALRHVHEDATIGADEVHGPARVGVEAEVIARGCMVHEVKVASKNERCT